MSLPYFPMYPKDFEADTSHLTLEEDGAYNRLLRICWMQPGASLPDDEAWIMRRMRVDKETYDRVVVVVLNEFFIRAGGRVSNARMNKEFDESVTAHKRRVEAGKMGAKSKSLKINNIKSSNAIAMLKQPEPEPEPYKIDDDDDAREAHFHPASILPIPQPEPPTQSDRQPTERERVLAAISPDIDQIGGVIRSTGRFIGASVDMGVLSQWKSDLGLTIDEIITVIQDVMLRKLDGPPTSFRYFTGAMQQFAGQKNAPKLALSEFSADQPKKPNPENDPLVIEAVEVFKTAATRCGWPMPQRMTQPRAKAIAARLVECGGIEGWHQAIEKAEASDFLSGRSASSWSGFSIDWMSKPVNFTKLMEGNYDQNRSISGQQPQIGGPNYQMRGGYKSAGAKGLDSLMRGFADALSA